MKVSDDYRAKIRLWAAAPRVVGLPPGPRLPGFRPQRFSSYEEMNRWKESLLREVARTNRPQDQPDIEFLTELERLGKL